MEQGNKRPNILLILTDELRFDAVGYINPVVKTPNLNQLANDSIVFENAYSTNPSCVPARAAIVTGRFPSQCGAPTFITYLPDTETTFMSLLQKVGYFTAVVGKQHFATSAIRRGYNYEEIDGDYTLDDSDRHNSISLSIRNLFQQFLSENGLKQKDLSIKDSRYTNRWKADAKFHFDGFIGERAKKWLNDKKPTDKPWFFCTSFHGPHQPFDGIGLPHTALYDEKTLDLPYTGKEDMALKPPHFRAKFEEINKATGEISHIAPLTDEEIKHIRLSYYSKISMIDEKIGEIIQILKESGEYDNTMIIFTADHGDFMGDYGTIYKGQYLSEVLMRIPFLIKPPIPNFKGKREKTFISSVEIAATCLDAAGAAIPENMCGRSLAQFWKVETDLELMEDMYMEAQNIRAIRDNQWKLVYYANRSYGELYNLKEDPWERNNLWEDVSYDNKKLEMMNKLMDWAIRLGAKSSMPWNVNAPEI